MPGVPTGPTPRRTSTSPGRTTPSSMPAIADGASSNTRAGPSNACGRSSVTESFTIAEPGASDPRTTTMVGWSAQGSAERPDDPLVLDDGPGQPVGQCARR